jgi:hypothetical protein
MSTEQQTRIMASNSEWQGKCVRCGAAVVTRTRVLLHTVLPLNSPLHAVTMFIQGKHRCWLYIRSNCVFKTAKFVSIDTIKRNDQQRSWKPWRGTVSKKEKCIFLYFLFVYRAGSRSHYTVLDDFNGCELWTGRTQKETGLTYFKLLYRQLPFRLTKGLKSLSHVSRSRF